MKKTLLLIFLLTFSGVLLAQERSFDIAIHVGTYSTPKFEKAQTGLSYSADFDYHLKNGWIISSGFNFGQFRYYESKLSNEPNSIVLKDGTNAEVADQQVSIKIKKNLLKEGTFNIRIGTGITLLTETKKYPLRYSNNSVSYAQSTFTDLAFPVSIEPYCQLFSRISLGLKAEMYIEPDFPVMGLTIGPQVRIKF